MVLRHFSILRLLKGSSLLTHLGLSETSFSLKLGGLGSFAREKRPS
jgi:hypothetical protein